jgi:hypothetical protein
VKFVSPCSSLKVTKSSTHTVQLEKLVLYVLIFRVFWYETGLNSCKHSLNLIYSGFHHECHSDLLVSSPSIWILPHFQTIH